jgi:uncharacterized membrane protein
MPDLTLFQVILIAATFSCSLLAGFLLAFAIVVMPGLSTLDDPGFVRGFRAIDLVIQKRQPLFILLWAGSLVSLGIAGWMGLDRVEGPWRILLASTALANVLGIHVPTLVVNVPLNNRLQSLRMSDLDAAQLRSERQAFEGRWNRWNIVRTLVACLVSLVLIVTLLRALPDPAGSDKPGDQASAVPSSVVEPPAPDFACSSSMAALVAGRIGKRLTMAT